MIYLKKLIIFLFILLISKCYGKDEYKTVQTDSGLVRGKKLLTLFDNKPYYSFQGIPYARPPIQDLRFKPPKAAVPWRGVKDVFEFGSECMQPKEILAFAPVDKYIVGSEDCLFINVYTPDVTANLPVMFFIHGGGFLEGSANIYGPDFIINQNDVILVTINYRIGIFGFLSFDTPEYSGNMGLKDQLFALKWVNRNIGNFGGNKDMVTIFGESAGSGSAHYHTITQQNSKLFKRAILMSGVVKNGWARRYANDHTLEMFGMARQIGSPVSNKEDLIKLFKTIDPDILIEHAVVPVIYVGAPRKTVTFFNYVPVVESKHALEPYLTEDINEMIGRDSYRTTIDTMFGFTAMEAYFMVNEEIKEDSYLRAFNKNFEFQLPLDHDIDIQYKSKEYKTIAKKVRDYYFGDAEVNQDSAVQYVDLQSAMWFLYGIDLAVKEQAPKSSGKTFYYVFSVDDENNFVKKLLNIKLPGASHFDEICYIFRCPVPGLYENFGKNSKGRENTERITKLWVNFAKFGDPSIPSENVVIKPIQGNDINFFNITNTGIEIGKNPRKELMEFWDNIYSEHRDKYKKSTLQVKNEL